MFLRKSSNKILLETYEKSFGKSFRMKDRIKKSTHQKSMMKTIGSKSNFYFFSLSIISGKTFSKWSREFYKSIHWNATRFITNKCFISFTYVVSLRYKNVSLLFHHHPLAFLTHSSLFYWLHFSKKKINL